MSSICLIKSDYGTNSLQCIHGSYHASFFDCRTLGPVQKAALSEAYAATISLLLFSLRAEFLIIDDISLVILDSEKQNGIIIEVQD